MSLATDLTAREAEIIRTLKLLSEHKETFVVIGGYAVNAITSHRFSVDCDLVLARKNSIIIRRILKEEDYKVHRKHANIEIFSKSVGKGKVSVDLFLNKLVCRQTGGSWKYEFIKKNAFEADVIGLTGATRAFVPRKELLIAMKIHTGRDADLRDVVMMSEHVDWKVVSEFANTGLKREVIRQIENSKQTIDTTRFSSALKAEFALTSNVTPLIDKSVQGLEVLRTEIEKRTRDFREH